jgi:hypothetical protein
MHECPECGQACDCDGEDTWFENVTDCACTCWIDDMDEDEFWDDVEG